MSLGSQLWFLFNWQRHFTLNLHLDVVLIKSLPVDFLSAWSSTCDYIRLRLVNDKNSHPLRLRPGAGLSKRRPGESSEPQQQ